MLMANCLPNLLLLYWVLASGSVVVTLLPGVPLAFKAAVYLSACRGKLWQDKPVALGPLRDWSVPQKWFLHFYVTGSCCNAIILAIYCLSSSSTSPTADTLQPLLALLLFQVHLMRRALETQFLLHYPPGAAMHGIAYVFGMSYYIAVPLSLLPSSWYYQQQWQRLAPVEDLPGMLQQQLSALSIPSTVSLGQALGVACFLFGNVLQYASHKGLAALTEEGPSSSKRAVYKIPRGGAFELVSCPHYLAEIIIYCGLVLLMSGQLLALLILVWVGVNLVLAAAANHKWYRQQFMSYPLSRKAMVPYIF